MEDDDERKVPVRFVSLLMQAQASSHKQNVDSGCKHQSDMIAVSLNDSFRDKRTHHTCILSSLFFESEKTKGSYFPDDKRKQRKNMDLQTAF